MKRIYVEWTDDDGKCRNGNVITSFGHPAEVIDVKLLTKAELKS